MLKGVDDMTNVERSILLFLKQYPQFEDIREHLSMNIYGDILDMRQAENHRVIAISDCRHDLKAVHYDLPAKWELKH